MHKKLKGNGFYLLILRSRASLPGPDVGKPPEQGKEYCRVRVFLISREAMEKFAGK